ncbi:MAG: hypothetical protein JXR96_25325 [Deltaproteobacteria bacterium]|nr:hypothetical protein [Deltaproteobacteria bacterium]
MKTKCPVCGSEDVREERVAESLPVPYGPAASFTTTQYTCNTCGESGDFTGANSSIINDAIRKSSAESAASMLEHLAGEGISSAYFERAMRLPARTTARWKYGELSAAALALLRSVRTYPWLLEVADADFEPVTAKTGLIGAAASALGAELERHVSEYRIGVAVSPYQVSIAADVHLVGQYGAQVSTESSEQLVYSEPIALPATGSSS